MRIMTPAHEGTIYSFRSYNSVRYPNERLMREQALKGMTLDAAYASFAEKEIGSLTIGKKADFVVFDKDFMTLPFDEILQAKVLTTVVDGEVAYGKLI